MRPTNAQLLLAATALGLAPLCGAAQEPRHESDFALMMGTKVLCSAVFVSGRDATEAFWNSAYLLAAPYEPERLSVRRQADTERLRYGLDASNVGALLDRRVTPDLERYVGTAIDVVIDRGAGEVSAEWAGYRARARHYGDQGCVLLRPGWQDVFFEPVPVRTALPDAATQAWPMGDRDAVAQPAPGVDRAKLAAAVEAAFQPEALTVAFVVLHGGRIIAERYDLGVGPETQLESWSMGKSVTATLIGLLIEQGHLGLHDPAPVPLWHADPEDPRSRIRVSDLLRMSSGLRFSGFEDPPRAWGRREPDHTYVYSGATDVFELSITAPAEHPPNTVGRYRNSDPLTLGYIVKRIVEQELGEEYLSWPQRALFDRIGVRRQVLEPDPYGNFLLTGYDYGAARNWARLGLLYLRDGVWQGERLLPAGFVDFVTTRAPAWPTPNYGGLFWLNGDCPAATSADCRDPRHPPPSPEYARRTWNLPASAWWMSGGGGTARVLGVPTHDLVIVRLGHRRAAAEGNRTLNEALGLMMEAIPRAP